MKVGSVEVRLLTPTNRTTSGLRLSMDGNRWLSVEYDYEEDDGSVSYGRVTFEELLSYQFWDSSCCPAENVLAPTEVRTRNHSDYLEVVLARWEGTVGHDAWQKEQGGRQRFWHFTLYFDDAGSLDVIATMCKSDQ